MPPAEFRFDLEGSGLSCGKAQAIAILMVGGVKGPQTIGSGLDAWTCRSFPPSAYPLKIRCRHGARSFTVEGAGPQPSP